MVSPETGFDAPDVVDIVSRLWAPECLDITVLNSLFGHGHGQDMVKKCLESASVKFITNKADI